MTTSPDPTFAPPIRRLLDRVATAARLNDIEATCAGVKAALCEEIVDGGLELPRELVRPSSDRYARRLLAKCPDNLFAIVIMVWGTGQGTPIHDHAGKWCVECVYDGLIKVTSYDRLEETETTARFRAEDVVFAEKGNAGALIPPRDYHVIENAREAPSVTIHVYGGEMDGCHAFFPLEADCYEKKWCDLCYTPIE
ncbi:MAG: cysteine dioxygenase family protein [Planctomycetes bacterium]|nr:cysteine dioxygenase family protein [Planctomycetota bacterium]